MLLVTLFCYSDTITILMHIYNDVVSLTTHAPKSKNKNKNSQWTRQFDSRPHSVKRPSLCSINLLVFPAAAADFSQTLPSATLLKGRPLDRLAFSTDCVWNWVWSCQKLCYTIQGLFWEGSVVRPARAHQLRAVQPKVTEWPLDALFSNLKRLHGTSSRLER